MDGDENVDDLDNDFIRKPKCYHSTPRLKADYKNDGRASGKLFSQCDNTSLVEKAVVYFNPFTPDGKVIATKVKAQKKFKRLCISELPPSLNFDDSATPENPTKSDSVSSLDIPKRPRLREFNVSRFNEEFITLEKIGKGVYGSVYKCLNRMNGCIYAVKKTLHPIKTEFQERIVRNEIYAHGILNHPNVLCNYSSWIEDDHAFIQNEFCDLGSLEGYVKTNVMSESLLQSLLLQVAQALNYIHSKGLAHMDIKPGNILLKTDIIKNDDSGIGETDDITFKLGDFGHITSLDEDSDIEEGDCRYVTREVLEGNLRNLDKSDIFSLGLTVYEISGGGPLPKNGDEWHEIRNGKLKTLDNLSKEFNGILKDMIHPQPDLRPSASALVKMVKFTQSLSLHSEDDLNYMQQYYHSNTRLEHKVEATGHYLRELFKSHRQLQDQFQSGIDSFEYHSSDKFSLSGMKNGGETKTRVVGKKARRSNSTMF